MYGVLWALLSLLGYGWLAYGTARTDSAQLLLLWAGLFALYALLFFIPKHKVPLAWLLGAAIAGRLVWLVAVPALSDDIYRFIWDGQLLAHGHNPYQYLPTDLLKVPWARAVGLDEVLYARLNSPHYYSVYPPLLQGWFAVATTLGGASTLAAAGWLRLPIGLAEVGTLLLLPKVLVHYGLEKNAAQRRAWLLYGLNPFLIVELVGNLHYEGVTIFFMMLCLSFYQKQKRVLSALALALAVGFKLLPLIFLPLLLHQLPGPRRFRYLTVVGVGVLLPFAFFFNPDQVLHFSSSLDLYFRRFEFNAGLYYLLRAVGTWLLGYNPIGLLGPLLSLLSLGGILFLSYARKVPFTLPERLLLILTVYLFCATTVHPWYVAPLLALGTFTHYRYPLLWSVLLPLTYLAYAQVPFQEPRWVLVLEYGLVWACLAWELRRCLSTRHS
ncbi:DUF2029 domain-containing protein [Rhabdobacter roseus]